VRTIVFLAALAPIVSNGARAEIVAEYRGVFAKPESSTQSYSFDVSGAHREYGIGVTAVLDAGSGSLRAIDPAGQPVYQHLWGTRDSQERARLPIAQPGTYALAVAADNARGAWRARVVALPARAALRWMYASAALLAAVPLSIIAIAHWRGAAVRYAAAGALMFATGRALWFAGAIALDLTAKYALEDAMPYAAFLWTQSVLLGLWQGAAATIGVVIVALALRRLREKPAHAIAAGIGAGAFEMLVNSALSFRGLAIMFGGGPKSDMAQFRQAYDMAVTPLLPLAEPIIYVMQTVCGAGATLLVIYGLRARRAGPVFGGGALFAAALTAIGASRTIALFGPESRWVLVAVLAPVAALSYLLARRNVPAWAERPVEGETALDAFERLHGPAGE